MAIHRSIHPVQADS
jgi:NAD(P)-dependent dehydrogenase (short-subunit alcohol dehydrogenase family)